MAKRFNSTLQLGVDRQIQLSNGDSYETLIDTRLEVDAQDSSVVLFEVSPTGLASALPSSKAAKFMCIHNEGDQTLEIHLEADTWTAAAPDTYAGTTNIYDKWLLLPNQFMVLPSNKNLNYTGNTSAALGSTIDDKLWHEINSSNMYSSSVCAVETESTGTDDTFIVTDAKKLQVGDIIQFDSSSQEYARIKSITDTDGDGDFTVATVTAERGLFGGAAAANWADGTPIYLPMWNQSAKKYNHFSKVQTDASGRFICTNLLGDLTRTGGGTDNASVADGIVAGSLAIKFYEAGYQELGLSGITPSSKTGLVASTAYKIDIQVDGGTMFQDLTVTTDSSNGNFGGRNGLIQKIQDALDVQYYTAGNLYEKRVYVAIVGGDVRFTSGQHLSTSAIALTDTGDSLSLFDSAAVGRIPAATALESAVAARLPDDTVIREGVEYHNTNAFAYDDGRGNIVGAASGTIDYRTSSINMTGAPANAEFAVSLCTGSALGSNPDLQSHKYIKARSTNPKRNGKVRFLLVN